MIELPRRFFLGGAIALIAAQIFKPSVNAMTNMPTIYGDGLRDDSFGLSALFRNEPVIFDKDQVGVDEHKGIVFHKGNFVVLNTIDVPKELKLEIEYANFSDAILELQPSKVFSRPKEFLNPSDPFFRFYDKEHPYDAECFRQKGCFVSNINNRPLIETIGFSA